MSVHPSVCPLDCPDACSLEVTVEGGQVTTVDGGHANPLTEGYICAKVRRFPEAMYGPERVMHPAIRVGEKGSGRFEDVSWDVALDRIAERFAADRDRLGGESILPLSYGGSNGLLSQDTTDARLFRRLGASRLARTVCAIPTGLAAKGLYGKMAGVAYQDYREAELVVVWGMNPHASGIHLVPHLQAAQDRGAKLVVVDPRRIKLADRADLHLAPYPGTDVALAMAVIHWLFENGHADTEFLAAHAVGTEALRERAAGWTLEKAAGVCRMTPQEIETFAGWFAEANPAVIRCGWGLERNRNGGSAVASVLALPAVGGKFGVRGGGYTMSNSGVWPLESDAGAGVKETNTRVVNMNRIGRALTGDMDPPVTSLFVYNCNPVATLPNQDLVRRGMQREDLFTVVFDSFWTDSARLADVVLPASTFLERRDVRKTYGAFALQQAHAVVPGVGESRSNHDVFLDLCRRLELEESGDAISEDAMLDAMLVGNPDGERIGRELRENGITLPAFGDRPVQFVDVFPGTPDRKVHLIPDDLDREAPEGLYAFRNEARQKTYPLALISPSSKKMISSTLGQLVEGQVPLDINLADAKPRGISSGDEVRVWNDYGEVRCQARVSGKVRLGVVQLPKGLWARHTTNGNTSNALAPDTLTDVGGGACFNDARVQVEKAGGDEAGAGFLRPVN